MFSNWHTILVFILLRQSQLTYFSDKNTGSLQLLVVVDNAQNFIWNTQTYLNKNELNWKFISSSSWEFTLFQFLKWLWSRDKQKKSSINICFIILLLPLWSYSQSWAIKWLLEPWFYSFMTWVTFLWPAAEPFWKQNTKTKLETQSVTFRC